MFPPFGPGISRGSRRSRTPGPFGYLFHQVYPGADSSSHLPRYHTPPQVDQSHNLHRHYYALHSSSICFYVVSMSVAR